MSGRKIIEWLNEALAWIRGEGTMRVSVVNDGKVTSAETTFDEYTELRERGMTEEDVQALAEKAFREKREIII